MATTYLRIYGICVRAVRVKSRFCWLLRCYLLIPAGGYLSGRSLRSSGRRLLLLAVCIPRQVFLSSRARPPSQPGPGAHDEANGGGGGVEAATTSIYCELSVQST